MNFLTTAATSTSPVLTEEGDAVIRSTFGSKYQRLVALKNKCDPTNLFRLNSNIKPHS
jgi:hypothetical protein